MSPCPKCKRQPDARDVVPELGMARCAACGETWSEAVAAEPPAGVDLHDDGEMLVLGARTREVGTFIELAFMLVWTGVAALFTVIGVATGFVPFLAISVLFVCIGVFRIVAALVKLFGHRRVEIGRGFLRVFTGPPDREEVAVPLADVALVEIDAGSLQNKVVARLRDGRRIDLVGAGTFASAGYVAAQVRRRLEGPR